MALLFQGCHFSFVSLLIISYSAGLDSAFFAGFCGALNPIAIFVKFLVGVGGRRSMTSI